MPVLAKVVKTGILYFACNSTKEYSITLITYTTFKT